MVQWDVGLGSITSRNLSGLAANFHAADRECQQAIRAVLQKSSQRTYERAYRACPVRTGFMRRQLRVVFSERGYTYQVGFWESDFRRNGRPFYALYVLFGTRYQPANDFLFPAHWEEQQIVLPELSAAIQGALARAA